MDMEYEPKGKRESRKNLIERLEKLENELTDLTGKYEERDAELENLREDFKKNEEGIKQRDKTIRGLRKELREKPNMTSYGVEFGGTTDVYCPECKNSHTIPYIPGEYMLCRYITPRGDSYRYIVTVANDGAIKVDTC